MVLPSRRFCKRLEVRKIKIAIASKGKDENSEISDQAGRSPYYLIFDEKGELLEVISNPFRIGGGGAGFAVAKMLADREVNLVIAGKIGDKMKGALETRGLKYQEKSGIVKEVLEELKKS